MSPTSQVPAQGVRRIVTTHGPSGTAIVQSDKHIELETTLGTTDILGGNIWRTEEWPCKDNIEEKDGAEREITDTKNFGLVGTNGANVRSTDLAPGATTPMHRTTTIDFNILVEGSVVLILDDGSETEVTGVGSTIVQRGTIHAWRNPSTTKWARWVSVIMPAQPAVVNGAEMGPALEH